MKKITTFLFLGMLSSLSAYIHPCSGQWGIQGEFLYLKPSSDDTFFAIDNRATISGVTPNKINNDYNFAPGFRVEGAYGFCNDAALIVRYSRLRTTETATVSGLISPVNTRFSQDIFTGQISSHLDLLYQNAEALYTMGLWNECRINLALQGGIEFAYIRQNEQFQSAGTNAPQFSFIETKLLHEKTWGIGPEVGLAFNFDLFDISPCFGKVMFVSRAASSLLVSETTYNEHDRRLRFQPVSFNVQDDSTWRIVPAWHARFGFNYEKLFSCANASLEVGYEFHSYLRAISSEQFSNFQSTRSASTSVYDNFDLNGLYVALGLGF